MFLYVLLNFQILTVSSQNINHPYAQTTFKKKNTLSLLKCLEKQKENLKITDRSSHHGVVFSELDWEP